MTSKRTSQALRNLGASAVTFIVATQALAFEDSKVLPQGVRRFSLKIVGTTVGQKTNNSGEKLSLGSPLEKDLAFKDILKAEKDPVKKNLTKSFLANEKFAENESVGRFAADIKSQTTVYAPIFAYGLSSSFTIAVAVPVYSMKVAIDNDFSANDVGQRFVNRLRAPENNQVSSSTEAATKINDAVGRLNTKLLDNNYRRLENWSAVGLGDAQIAGKWQFLKSDPLSSSVTGAVVFPTGRRDDPNNLLDKGFGDGQWDLVAQNTWDQNFGGSPWTLSESVKYTHQLPGRKTVRLSTSQETIEVGSASTKFKLGDKAEALANLQFAGDSGFVGGGGYSFYSKGKDVYRDIASDSKQYLEKDSLEQQHQVEVEIGYSGVPAYRRGQIPAPFETKLNYKHQLASRNMPVAHLLQVDMAVFF